METINSTIQVEEVTRKEIEAKLRADLVKKSEQEGKNNQVQAQKKVALKKGVTTWDAVMTG